MKDNELRMSEVPGGLVVAGVQCDEAVLTNASGFVASQAAGGGIERYTGARPTPTCEEIAQLAYSLYESRGRQYGNDMDDWLRAEQMLARHYA